MAGIKEVARRAGVSVATVSNAVNGRKNVSEDTRERILKICEEMHYYPNAAGKNLKAKENRTILFTMSDFDRNFYLQVIKGINDYLKDKDYDLLICTEQACEKFMSNKMSSGCIVLNAHLEDGAIHRCANENYPIVALDRVLYNSYVKSVVVNNYDAMYELVQEMVKRGYRRFAFVGGPEDSIDNQERYQAFVDVLEKNQIPFPRKNYFNGDWREKSGYTAGKILGLADFMPDALVCANDNMAVGAIRAFREDGVRVPEDMAVTGFDDNYRAEEYSLTTVNVPEYERGYLAAMYLLEMLKKRGDAEVFRISVKVKWRNSVLTKKE